MRGRPGLVSRGTYALILALAALAPLAVHWVRGRTVAWWDAQSVWSQERWIVDEALRAFRLPLWNPYKGGGMPLLADAISGALHPVSILTAWLGTGRSVDVVIGAHVICAALGAALLARELGAGRPGAALAALAYATSGYVLSMTGNVPYLSGAGSLPLCVAGLLRFARAPGPGSLSLGAGGAAVLALSGEAQALMVGGALAFALSWEAGGWRGALRAVAAGGVGLLLAGAQLVPSLAHLPRSDRAEGMWTSAPMVWALAPWRLPELLLPGLCAGPNPAVDRVFGGLAGPERWPEGFPPAPFAASVFVGLVPLSLALAGARDARRGKLLAILALGLLWVALGGTLGADAVLREVPIWRAFRFPEKLVGPLTLVLAALAGLGLDAVVGRRIPGWQVLAGAAALAIAAIGAGQLAGSRLGPEVATMAGARVLRGAWHVVAGLVALAAWILARERLPAQVGSIALVVLAWGGMVAAAPAALHPGDPAARLRSPGPALHPEGGRPRILTPYRTVRTLPDAEQDQFDQFGRWDASLGYPSYHVASRLDSLSEISAMIPRRLALLKQLGARWPVVARRYALTHVILDEPLNAAQRTMRDLATRGATRLSRERGREIWAVPHREWASFAPDLRIVKSEEDALLGLGQAFFEGSEAVVIEAERALGVAPGRVLSAERGLESLRIEAESDAPATLVVADAYWPGWEATLDGAPVSVFPADVLVRAVAWPAGRHVLEMRYRPPEVVLGALASALGIAALAVWVARLRGAPTRLDMRTAASEVPPGRGTRIAVRPA
jgi:hypothetical protein